MVIFLSDIVANALAPSNSSKTTSNKKYDSLPKHCTLLRQQDYKSQFFVSVLCTVNLWVRKKLFTIYFMSIKSYEVKIYYIECGRNCNKI